MFLPLCPTLHFCDLDLKGNILLSSHDLTNFTLPLSHGADVPLLVSAKEFLAQLEGFQFDTFLQPKPNSIFKAEEREDKL